MEDHLSILDRIQEIYSEGKNIIRYLRELDGRSHNTIEDIMISYDFQAGTYIKEYENNPSFYKQYCSHLASVIMNLGQFESILEVGVGEATTIGTLLPLLNETKRAYGFDISWSRLKYARHFLEKNDINNVQLFVGDLFCAPLKNNSVDIVYTSHSIEPNGGHEKEALEELYRITNKFLVLLEPAYEFGSKEAKERMIYHGYITRLYKTARELGYNIIEHRLFDVIRNPLNPTGLTIIQKKPGETVFDALCCPITKTNLTLIKGVYYSPESRLVYPIIDEIPCLLKRNAIVASKFLDNFN